jgi:hypothetical protein
MERGVERGPYFTGITSEESGNEHKAVPDCYDTACKDDGKRSSQVFDETGALVWWGHLRKLAHML